MADTYGGHVKLDGVPYAIHASQWQRTVADRMAAKTGRGTTTYADQQNWDYYVQQDFSGGLGQTDEAAPGARVIVGDCLIGSGIRPIANLATSEYTDAQGHSDRLSKAFNGTVTVGTATNSDYVKLAHIFADNPTTSKFFVLHMMVVTPSTDTTVTWEIFEGTSASDVTPTGGVLDSGSFTISADNIPGLQYKTVEIDIDPAVGTNYTTIVLSCATSFELGYHKSEQTQPGVFAWSDGSSWSTSSVHQALFDVREYGIQDYISPEYFIPGSNLYERIGDGGKIYQVQANNWDGTAAYIRDTGITSDATCWAQAYSGNYVTDIYVGFGSAHQIRRHSAGAWSTLSKYADAMDIGGGFLWIGYKNKIYYTSDNSTFTEVETRGTVLSVNFHIDKCYYLSTDGLWYVGSGDVPIPVVKGMAVHNDAGLYSWRGLLYIVNKNELFEFDGTTIRNISPLAENDGVSQIADGTITAISGCNQLLFLGVTATSGQRSSIMAYNGSGWTIFWLLGNDCTVHSIRSVATTAGGSTLLPIDTAVSVLTSSGRYEGVITLKSTVPYPPVTSFSSSYTHPTWVETPWIFANTRALNKDWESISVSYRLQHDNPIRTQWKSTVYYKEEGDTTWTAAGTTTHTNTEAIDEYRFSDLDNRPSGAKVKVGVLSNPMGSPDSGAYFQQSVFSSQAVRLDSIIVKYHAMLRDRYQWNLSVIVSDSLGLPSGKRHPYSKKQMIDHLDELVKKQGPFIYTDIDGKQYEVKVLAGNSRIAKSEWKGGKLDVEYVYNMTLDQVTTEEYSA